MLRKQTIETMKWKNGASSTPNNGSGIESLRLIEEKFYLGGSALWNRRQPGYKRKPRDIWIHYEVDFKHRFQAGVTKMEVLTISVAMTASQMRIAETIDAFYGDAGANDGVSRSYKQAVEDLDAETIKALDGPFR